MGCKKAQAAMEFLMNYGWAILAIIAIIAVLAYFGVLSPDRFLPHQCTLPSGLACPDFSVGGNSTDPVYSLILQNSGGFDMSNIRINFTTPSRGGCTESSIASLTDGSDVTVNITCTDQVTGKFKSEIQVVYTNVRTGLEHTKRGTFISGTRD